MSPTLLLFPAAVLCSLAGASPLEAALAADDACAAGSTTQECELSLRQLRGDMQQDHEAPAELTEAEDDQAGKGKVSCCCVACGSHGCSGSILQCNACDDNSCPNQVNWGLSCAVGDVSSDPGRGCSWNV
mmetsp:Transcript_8356/g.19777  ORF Transcript_8356/g.19777 Transcript_8356/m.19777 type:complete len:130 (-) Transcript_8356:69-458(-)